MNILSADGGGIRGVITIRILEEIEKRSGKRISELFNFCVGSSIATILIAGLFFPDPDDPSKPQYTAEQIKNIIVENGPKIFATTYLGDIKGLWGLRRPRYSHKTLRSVIEMILGKNTIYGDLMVPCLFPARDTFSGSDIYIYNRDISSDKENMFRIMGKDINLSDLLCGTTAAPYYFPSQKINVDNRLYNLIDSGTVVNDGCELALLECEKLFDVNKDDIYELSVGTGKVNNTYNSSSWGLYEWGSSIVPLLISGNTENQEYELILSMGDKYRKNYDRLNPTIPTGVDYLDRPEYIDQYLEITEKWINNNSDLIDKVITRLVRSGNKKSNNVKNS